MSEENQKIMQDEGLISVETDQQSTSTNWDSGSPPPKRVKRVNSSSSSSASTPFSPVAASTPFSPATKQIAAQPPSSLAASSSSEAKSPAASASSSPVAKKRAASSPAATKPAASLPAAQADLENAQTSLMVQTKEIQTEQQTAAAPAVLKDATTQTSLLLHTQGAQTEEQIAATINEVPSIVNTFNERHLTRRITVLNLVANTLGAITNREDLKVREMFYTLTNTCKNFDIPLLV